MRVTADVVGRLVVPKALREKLGLSGPGDVEATAADGRVEATATDVPARVAEEDGFHVITPDQPVTPLTVEQTRDAIDGARR